MEGTKRLPRLFLRKGFWVWFWAIFWTKAVDSATVAPKSQWVGKRTTADYERCVRLRGDNPQPHTPRDELYIAGYNINLKCPNLCLKPEESSRELWKYTASVDSDKKTPVVPRKEFKINRDLSLGILMAGESDSGTYYCVNNGKIEMQHHIQVVTQELSQSTLIQSNESRPLSDEFLSNNNLKVFTKWRDWSGCSSRCNKTGYQRRVGICFVSKIDDRKPANPDVPQLRIYNSTGISCRSQSLPQSVAQLKAIKGRESEIFYRFCRGKCNRKKMRDIKNRKGEVIERINESKGKMSFLEEPPVFSFERLKKDLRSHIIYANHGSSVNITCSRSSLNEPIVWRNGSHRINRFKIHGITKGRIVVDSFNRLIIREVRKSDNKKIFSCWVRDVPFLGLQLRVRDYSPVIDIYIGIHNIEIVFLLLVIVIAALSIWRNTRELNKS